MKSEGQREEESKEGKKGVKMGGEDGVAAEYYCASHS